MDSSGNPTSSRGCIDGYVSSSGDCTASCGIAKYGSATYKWRGLDSSTC